MMEERQATALPQVPDVHRSDVLPESPFVSIHNRLPQFEVMGLMRPSSLATAKIKTFSGMAEHLPMGTGSNFVIELRNLLNRDRPHSVAAALLYLVEDNSQKRAHWIVEGQKRRRLASDRRVQKIDDRLVAGDEGHAGIIFEEYTGDALCALPAGSPRR
jgi:hypothetical protein